MPSSRAREASAAAAIERERRQPRPGLAGEHAPGRHPVAREQRADERHVDGHAAGRVPGRRDHPRRARQVEGGVTGDRDELVDLRRPEPALAQTVGHEPEERPDLDRPPAAARLLHLAPRPRHIGLVDVHGHAELAMEPAGEPDVVGVPVGEHGTADVRHRAAHGGELRHEVAELAGHAGVDDRDRPALLDEIAVDEAVAEPAQAGCEFHVGLPVSRAPGRAPASSPSTARTRLGRRARARPGSPRSRS